MLTYFDFLVKYLSVGPPFYITLNTTELQYDFSDTDLQNKIAGSYGYQTERITR